MGRYQKTKTTANNKKNLTVLKTKNQELSKLILLISITNLPKPITIMFDAVCAKQALIKQINSKPSNMVENWKQSARDSRAEILGNRKRVMDQISFDNIKLTPCKPSDSETTIEAKYNVCMSELKEKAGKQVVEAWKSKAIESRRLIFATMHSVVAEIKTNKTLINCEIREFNFKLNSDKNAVEQFNLMLDQIRSPVEAWKQAKADNFSALIQTRKSVLCDISEKNYSLKKVANRRALLADIRAAYNIPESWTFCEAWKENIRNEKSKVLLAHKHCMVSVEQGKVSLKKTKNFTRKEQLQACLAMIRTEPVEAWKQKIQESRINTIENKKLVLSEILGFKTSELKIVENSVQNRKLAVNSEIKSK